MLLCTKLASERGEAEDTAGHEWEDGVRAVCDVVYAETLANNNVGRIPDEENHTRCIGCSKLGNKPSCRVQFYGVGIVHLTSGVIKLVTGQIDLEQATHQKGRAGQNNRIVSNDDAQQGEHNIEIEEKFPAVGSSFVADPKCSSLKHTGYVEGYRHICKRKEQYKNIVRLNSIGREYDQMSNQNMHGTPSTHPSVPTMPSRITLGPKHWDAQRMAIAAIGAVVRLTDMRLGRYRT